MDSASDFGSGGWGFESPLGLIFFWFFFGQPLRPFAQTYLFRGSIVVSIPGLGVFVLFFVLFFVFCLFCFLFWFTVLVFRFAVLCSINSVGRVLVL